MVFCQKNSIHLISDEVYALSVYDTDSDDKKSIKFSSALSIDHEGLIDPDRLHVFYGMSKVSKDLSFILWPYSKLIFSKRTLELLDFA
jgi:aspartate/methionine/tyrosine aminotransferase